MGAWEQRRKLGSKPVRGLAHKLYYIFGPEHALPRQGLRFRFGWVGRAQEKQLASSFSAARRKDDLNDLNDLAKAVGGKRSAYRSTAAIEDSAFLFFKHTSVCDRG